MSLFGSFGGAKTNAFGQTVNPQQPQQNQPPSSGFGAFGQQQQQSSTPSTGTGFGIFGAANNSNNTTTAQPTAAPSAFSGFGTSTSAFGSSTLGQQQQQPQQNHQSQPSPFSWGGFGTNNNTSAVNPTTAGTTTASGNSALGQTSSSPFSAFGLNQSTTQQSQPSSTNLFGSLSTQTQQQQPQSQAPTNSIFGSSNIFGQTQSTQPSNTGFGLGIPAQQQQQQPQQSALSVSNCQVQTSNPSVTKASKFNDLPDSAKNALENVDAFIQKFVQISTELKTMRLGEEAEKTSKLLAEIVPITQGVANIIVSDEDVTQDLRSKVDDITRDEVTAIQIIDGLRDPNKSVNLQAHAGFPLEYYTKLTHRLIERLQTYKNTVDAIERKLVSMSENHQRSPQAISGTLRAQHATFMALATRVAELEATLNKIRQVATAAWRVQTGSARNPFDPQFDVANALNASIYGSR